MAHRRSGGLNGRPRYSHHHVGRLDGGQEAAVARRDGKDLGGVPHNRHGSQRTQERSSRTFQPATQLATRSKACWLIVPPRTRLSHPYDEAVKRATTYGDWRVLSRIDGGGNGDVYRCQHLDGTEAAIKVLKRGRDWRGDRMRRFRNEINFLEERRNYPGVLPMLDHALPDDPAEPAWYVMPLATPLLEALGKAPEFSTVVDAIGHIAHTMACLAAEGVEGHRDIKPANLFLLDDEWVIGDFGLMKYPENESVTKQGRALGPADFMAPEMRRDADSAKPQPADVYSLAKTLWSVATGNRYPPPGELRCDRHELRLSSYVDDRRATLLEPLLERCTSHEPAARPAMRELAQELDWWSAPPAIPVQVDLSDYTAEVARIREANLVARVETEDERLARLYNEALTRVHSRLLRPLVAAVERSGLQNMGSVPGDFQGWFPDNYGGNANLPHWGIETLASPRLIASVGTVHRAKPTEDLAYLGVTLMLVMLAGDSQHIYLREFERFRAGSLHLDQILDQLNAKINAELPGILAHFLTACREHGIPRQ
jgi:Protein tyrosine and serine/threonine kinase